MGEVLIDAFKQFLANIQDYSRMAGQSLANLASGPRYFQDILDQMDDIGVGSLPIVLMAGFFIGAVMVLQTGSQFTRFGQTALTGDVVALALVRELGPTLTGILVAGRCASGIASELGSMLVKRFYWLARRMRRVGFYPALERGGVLDPCDQCARLCRHHARDDEAGGRNFRKCKNWIR